MVNEITNGIRNIFKMMDRVQTVEMQGEYERGYESGWRIGVDNGK